MAQAAHCILQRRGQGQPGGQAARLGQPFGQGIAREGAQRARAHLQSGELQANVTELVRLIEHHHARAGQQLGHARRAQRQVGEEQVVVDDHHVGCQRVGTGAVHMAGAGVRAGSAQAVVARGGDEREHGRGLLQAGQLIQVTAAGAARPLLHTGQCAQPLRIEQLTGHAPAGTLQTLQAEVAGAPLEQRRTDGHAQGSLHAGQVTQEKLVLQCLGGGRHQQPLAAEQRGHQVGKGLAHARAGLGDERATVLNNLRHGLGHGHLARTWAKMRVGLRQRPLPGKGLRHSLRKCAGHGVSDNNIRHNTGRTGGQDKDGKPS